MNTPTRVAFVSVMISALTSVGLGMGQPVMAAPPTVHTFAFSDQQTDRSLCGFLVVFTFTGTVSERDYVDGSGNLIRLDVHSADDVEVEGPTGKVASGHEVVDIRVDLDRQTEQHVGVPVHVGGLLLEAGRILIDPSGGVTVSGRHEVLGADVTKFCSALA